MRWPWKRKTRSTPYDVSHLTAPTSFEELVVRAVQGPARPQSWLLRLITSERFANGVAVFVCFSIEVLGISMLYSEYAWKVAIGGITTLSAAIPLIGNILSVYRSIHDARTTDAQMPSPATLIPAYLKEILRNEHIHFVGVDSPSHALLTHANDIERQVGALVAQLLVRMTDDERRGVTPAPYLARAAERASTLHARTRADIERIQAYRAKLDAFFNEASARIAGIERPLQDLELISRLDALETEGERLSADVETAIVTGTAALMSRLSATANALNAAVRATGIEVAVKTSIIGDVEGDLRQLEETIDHFTAIELPDDALDCVLASSAPDVAADIPHLDMADPVRE